MRPDKGRASDDLNKTKKCGAKNIGKRNEKMKEIIVNSAVIHEGLVVTNTKAVAADNGQGT